MNACADTGFIASLYKAETTSAAAVAAENPQISNRPVLGDYVSGFLFSFQASWIMPDPHEIPSRQQYDVGGSAEAFRRAAVEAAGCRRNEAQILIALERVAETREAGEMNQERRICDRIIIPAFFQCGDSQTKIQRSVEGYAKISCFAHEK